MPPTNLTLLNLTPTYNINPDLQQSPSPTLQPHTPPQSAWDCKFLPVESLEFLQHFEHRAHQLLKIHDGPKPPPHLPVWSQEPPVSPRRKNVQNDGAGTHRVITWDDGRGSDASCSGTGAHDYNSSMYGGFLFPGPRSESPGGGMYDKGSGMYALPGGDLAGTVKEKEWTETWPLPRRRRRATPKPEATQGPQDKSLPPQEVGRHYGALQVVCKPSNTGLYSFFAFAILSLDITADIMGSINININITSSGSTSNNTNNNSNNNNNNNNTNNNNNNNNGKRSLDTLASATNIVGGHASRRLPEGDTQQPLVLLLPGTTDNGQPDASGDASGTSSPQEPVASAWLGDPHAHHSGSSVDNDSFTSEADHPEGALEKGRKREALTVPYESFAAIHQWLIRRQGRARKRSYSEGYVNAWFQVILDVYHAFVVPNILLVQEEVIP